MKAKYMKPMLAMEIFSLTQSYARDCTTSYPSTSFTSGDPNYCVLEYGNGFSVFLNGTECMFDGEAMDFGCYNTPDGVNFIFRS